MTADPSSPWAGLGQRRHRPGEEPAPVPVVTGRTERLRQALRVHGALCAAELAAHGGFTDSALVGALLKHDLWKGRVSFDGERYALSTTNKEPA